MKYLRIMRFIPQFFEGFNFTQCGSKYLGGINTMIDGIVKELRYHEAAQFYALD